MATTNAPAERPVSLVPQGQHGRSNEAAIARSEHLATTEIQAALTIAQSRKRNEDDCLARITKSCQRTSFANDVCYQYKRGRKQVNGNWVDNIVKGPSVYFAKEFARIWGNIRFGFRIVADDEEKRTITGWAWDLETNTYSESEDDFKKYIQRSEGQGDQKQTVWKYIGDDEREMRELTNRRAAIAVRNAILDLLPEDMVSDAVREADKTMIKETSQDPDKARKNIVLAFSSLNVPIPELETYLGHPVASCSPEELVSLREMYKAIHDGQSRWSDFLEKKEEPAAKKPKRQPVKTRQELKDKLRQENEGGEIAGTQKPAKEPADTDAASEGQLHVIRGLMQDATLKDLVQTKLKEWGCMNEGELNAGSARELITLLDQASREKK